MQIRNDATADGEGGSPRREGKRSRGDDFSSIELTPELRAELLNLESLGVLAGGIAHDFNNLLTGIMGNASLILDTSSQLDPDRLSLEDIITLSKRAADLTNQLLAYVGKG